MSRGRDRPGRRQRREPTLGQFIRMRSVPHRRRKPNLKITKLLTRLEQKLSTGERTEGSVHASPSAPSYPEEDSDWECWGSDFDDGEDADTTPTEEMENDLNDMLQAALERNRKLGEQQFARSEAARGFPSRSDAPLSSERLDLTSSVNAPPVITKTPASSSSSSPSTHRSVSNTGANLPVECRSKIPASTQIKNQPHAITQTVSSVVANLSTSGATSDARGTPRVPNRSESPLQNTSRQTTPTFPPDVTTSSSNSPTSSRVPFVSSSVTANTSAPFQQREASSIARSSNKDTSNAANISKDFPIGNLPPGKFPVQTQAAVFSQPKRSTKSSVPPPLPTRPPPVRQNLQKLVVKLPPRSPPPLPPRPPSPPPRVASSPKDKNDAGIKLNPPQPLPNTAIKSQMTKGTSSLTNLAENRLQKSSVSEPPKPSTSSSACLPARDETIKLPEKLNPKRRSVALGIPKIIKKLDAAVLMQVTPKSREKSASIEEIEHSFEEKRNSSSSENSTLAENTENNAWADYLNPKEVEAQGPPFVPDRPTLPRRLKHSRSLPLLTLVGSLKREKPKNKVTVDEQNHPESGHQATQATNGTTESGLELSIANDEVFTQPWYHPVTWAQAQFKLTKMSQDGAFLVRPSSRISEGVPFTISVYLKGRVINCHISTTQERKYVLGTLKPNQKTFDSIAELIRYHQSKPAELKISEAEPASKVCFLITPPKNTDKPMLMCNQ